MDADATDGGGLPQAASVPNRRRFPYRVIPASSLCLYGGLVILHGAWGLRSIHESVRIIISPPMEGLRANHSVAMFALLMLVAHGCVAIWAGSSFWRRQWKRGIEACFIAILVLIIAVFAGSLIPNPSSYAVIPFVSAMNAVSKLISSSRNSVSLWPASINSVGKSL